MSVPIEAAEYLSEKLGKIIDGECEEFKAIVNRVLQEKIRDLTRKTLGYVNYNVIPSEYDDAILAKIKSKLDDIISGFEYTPNDRTIRQLKDFYNSKMYNLLKVQAEAQATEDFNKHKDQLNG